MKVLFTSPAKECIYAVLEAKDDLLTSIKKLADENNVEQGFVLALGNLRKLCLGFATDVGKFKKIEIEEPLEITTAFGSIWMEEEKKNIHVHINAASIDGKVYGGHLLEDTLINWTGVVVILKTQ
jgi:hypothetical protein